MSDPFAEFKQGQPPVEGDPPPTDKAPRKKRAKKANGAIKARAKVVEKQTETAANTTLKAAKIKKPRKPRTVKEFRLPISTFLEIGSLTGEEGSALMTIATGLQKMGKKSRGKIVAALGKVFG